MALKLLLFLTILLSHAAMAQKAGISVWNLYSKKERPVLFNNGQNLILLRLENASSINVAASDGVNILDTKVYNDSLLVHAFVYKAGMHELTLSDKNTGKTIGIIELTTEDVSEPFARVGDIKTSEVTRNALLLQQGLVIANTNEDYKYPVLITKYTFKAQLPGNTLNIKSTGPYFTKEIKDVFEQLPHNTIIEFIDLRATGPTICKRPPFPPIKLLVR